MTGIRILAIGGGGCTNHADPALDVWILSLLEKKRPRIGFLGTASGDSPEKIHGFISAFLNAAELAPSLAAGATADACAAWLNDLDMLYVGGGNLFRAMRAWGVSGWDLPLTEAARRGMMIAGVSAGAMCWFEQGFSSAGSDLFRAVPGLGLIPGSCCPHLHLEPERRPALESAIAEAKIADGIAIDDGVAVLCDETGPRSYFSAREGHAAYRYRREGGRAVLTVLPEWLSDR